MSYIPLTNSQSPASQAGRGKKKEPWLVNIITRAIPRSQNLELYLRNEQSRVYVRYVAAYTADQKFRITCSVKFNIGESRIRILQDEEKKGIALRNCSISIL